jgi:hypothetical protein
MFEKQIRAPILALFLISLGGLLLHLKLHWLLWPPKEVSVWLQVIFGGLTTFVLPFMFNNAKTIAWAYLINLAAIIVGTVAMAYFSFENWEWLVTVKTVILKSTLADILILWAKLPLAQIILRYWRPVKTT